MSIVIHKLSIHLQFQRFLLPHPPPTIGFDGALSCWLYCLKQQNMTKIKKLSLFSNSHLRLNRSMLYTNPWYLVRNGFQLDSIKVCQFLMELKNLPIFQMATIFKQLNGSISLTNFTFILLQSQFISWIKIFFHQNLVAILQTKIW